VQFVVCILQKSSICLTSNIARVATEAAAELQINTYWHKKLPTLFLRDRG